MPDVPRIQLPRFSPPSPGRVPTGAAGAVQAAEAQGTAALAEGATRLGEAILNIGAQHLNNRRVHQLSRAETAYSIQQDRYMKQELLRNNEELDRWPQLLDENRDKLMNDLFREFDLDEQGRQQLEAYIGRDHIQRSGFVTTEQVREQERLAVGAVGDQFEAGITARDSGMIAAALEHGRELGLPEDDLQRLVARANDGIRVGLAEDQFMQLYAASQNIVEMRQAILDDDNPIVQSQNLSVEERTKIIQRLESFHRIRERAIDPVTWMPHVADIRAEIRNRRGSYTVDELVEQTREGNPLFGVDEGTFNRLESIIESEQDEKTARENRAESFRRSDEIRLEAAERRDIEKEQDEAKRDRRTVDNLSVRERLRVASRMPDDADMERIFTELETELGSQNILQEHPDLTLGDAARHLEFMRNERRRRKSEHDQYLLGQEEARSEADDEALRLQLNETQNRYNSQFYGRLLSTQDPEDRRLLYNEMRRLLGGDPGDPQTPDQIDGIMPGWGGDIEKYVTPALDDLERLFNRMNKDQGDEVDPSAELEFWSMIIRGEDPGEINEWVANNLHRAGDKMSQWVNTAQRARSRDVSYNATLDAMKTDLDSALRLLDPARDKELRTNAINSYIRNVERYDAEFDTLTPEGRERIREQFAGDLANTYLAAAFPEFRAGFLGLSPPKRKENFIKFRANAILEDAHSSGLEMSEAEANALAENDANRALLEVRNRDLRFQRRRGITINGWHYENMPTERTRDGKQFRYWPKLIQGADDEAPQWYIIDRRDPDNELLWEDAGRRIAGPNE